MDRPASVEGLVVAGWVDGQRAEELPLLGHDADLGASHEETVATLEAAWRGLKDGNGKAEGDEE